MAFDKHEPAQNEFEFNANAQSRLPSFNIQVDGRTLRTTPVFEAYWNFAAKRQNIFFRRLHGANKFHDEADPVLAVYKFTNTYRASDRVSQYLIRHVIWNETDNWSDEDQFFRTLLFKLFNKIETWEAIESELGPVSWRAYDFGTLDRFLTSRMSAGNRNYSAAYIMPSAGRKFGHSAKHSNHLKLLEWMMSKEYPAQLRSRSSMAEAFKLLLSAPSIGPFLAYQFVTDLNYGPLTAFSEMEFVKAGPGALDGISKCFESTEGLTPEQIIQHMADHQDEYFDRFEIEFPSLWGRSLQLIDCQNLFCEISKYSRVAFPEVQGKSGRTRIKQKFKPVGRLPVPYYPPRWGLNAQIVDELSMT